MLALRPQREADCSLAGGLIARRWVGEWEETQPSGTRSRQWQYVVGAGWSLCDRVANGGRATTGATW